MNRKYLLLIGIMLFFPAFLFASPVATMNGWIEQHLSANNAEISSYLFLLLGGTLASLLPCTYPLYPITINILQSRASEKHKFLQPVIYFSGIVSMYFLFGIIASITGGAYIFH